MNGWSDRSPELKAGDLAEFSRDDLESSILIVDDQAAIRRAFERRLCDHGFEALEAESGEDALERVGAEEVDLVLLDIGLPDIDGFEVLEALRADFELSQLPIVMLTGNESEDAVLRALEMGANDYVTKGTDFQIALARIQTQLRLRHARERLVELAESDSLTGLLNRRAFFERLDGEEARFERSGRPYGLLMVDIDHFKELNDTYGHRQGDRVLEEFARRAEEEVRSIDAVGRIGGEEFAILVPEVTRSEVGSFAEGIRKMVADEPFDLEETSVRVTVSVGFAVQSRESPLDPNRLLEKADRAMYAAKESGRNTTRG